MEPLASPKIDPTAFVAPTAQIHGAVTIAARCVVMFGVVARAEEDRISVGTESNLQDLVVLHADAGVPCTIGARVTVGHAAVVHGATIGDHCLVGIRAVALNGSELGEGAWLAAGSLLPEGKKIPPWTLAVGTPARPVRELTEEERRRQREGVDAYLRFAEVYRRLLDPGP
ncbi:MAG TPA: gamma carbonic anhydrase family protein [Actinobacteria bacterium]|nr:gamma carbonic anhydrase family protein [Actinomycetota bacterium]